MSHGLPTQNSKLISDVLLHSLLASSRKRSCVMFCLLSCAILLGRTWIWDRDVTHAGCANTYSFVDGKTKYALTCASDPRTIRLKMNSLLIRRVPLSDGISCPLLSVVEFFSVEEN